MAVVDQRLYRPWASTRGENMVRLWTRYQGRFAHDELGVTITQYALIAAFIAVLAMAAAVFLGSEISGRFNEISDTAQSALRLRKIGRDPVSVGTAICGAGARCGP